MADGFKFWRSYHDSLKHLTDQDRLTLYDSIAAYALDGVEPCLEGVCAAVFAAIKPNIDNSVTASENGKKGGRPRKDSQEKKGGFSKTEKGGFEKPKSNRNRNRNREVIKSNNLITLSCAAGAAVTDEAAPPAGASCFPVCDECGAKMFMDKGRFRCSECGGESWHTGQTLAG